MRDFTGTWIGDLQRSKFVGPQPAAIRITIDHRDPDLKQDLIVRKADGSDERAELACRTTGEEGTLLFNGRPLRGTAKWVGEELIIESWLKAGERELYFCDCWSLSSNGQSLVMEHRQDTLAGQRLEYSRLSE